MSKNTHLRDWLALTLSRGLQAAGYLLVSGGLLAASSVAIGAEAQRPPTFSLASISSASSHPAAASPLLDTGIPISGPFVITDVAVGSHAVSGADLDNDGDLDIAGVSREDGKVRWFRNDGDRYEKLVIGVAEGAYDVHTADLDGDGDIDLVVAAVGALNPSAADGPGAEGGGSIIWYENDGGVQPGFVAHTVIDTLAYPVSVHSADLDRDGDQDLLSASRDDDKIQWYVNDGARPPTFAPLLITDRANGAVFVEAGDIDGDGDLDLASASEDDDQIAWYENLGGRPPAFAAHVVRISPAPIPDGIDYAKAAHLADVDGDGALDIVYAVEELNEVGWYENDGGLPPSFSQHVVTDAAQHVKFVASGDVDGDGHLDLLSASTDDDTVAWYANDGRSDPAFTRYVLTSSADGARGVAVGDFDGDGDRDIVAASRDDDRILLFANATLHRSALFVERNRHEIGKASRPRGADIGDLDGDGDLDVAVTADAEVAWYANEGGTPPQYRRHLIAADLDGGRWASIADLNGDGRLDIIAAAKDDNRILWYENSGGTSPTFRAHIITNNAKGARAALAADLDGDGDLDVYSASDGDDRIAWYENRGGSPVDFEERTAASGADYPRSTYAADLDGDGDVDLLSASQLDDRVIWYENNGRQPPTFKPHIVDFAADGVQHIYADDVDGDGDVDILSASEIDRTIAWYENRGGETLQFAKWAIDTNAPGAHAVYTADFDGDGDTDVAAAIELQNAVVWYENDGAQGFVRHTIYDKALAAHGVAAGDYDGDGDVDILAVARNDGSTAWFENRGGQYAIESAAEPSSVLAPGQLGSLLRIDVTHRGRPGESDLELAALDFVFLDRSGQRLPASQVSERITRLRLYRDVCCDGDFDPAAARLVAEVNPVWLTGDDRLVLSFTRAEEDVRVAVGAPAVFFVAVELGGACREPGDAFTIGLLVSARTARDVEHGAPLLAESLSHLDAETPTEPEAPADILLINEVMADNDSVFADPDEPGEYPDWIELYNAGPAPIDLGGMYLSDDPLTPKKFSIPKGVTIPAFGYLLFIADGDVAQGPRHTNFRLDRQGESLSLIASDEAGNRVIDVVAFGEQPTDTAYGRMPNGSGTWTQMDVPTPGAINVNSVLDRRFYLPLVRTPSGC